MNGAQFEKKSFTLPANTAQLKDCRHGWIDAKGKCVLCGEQNPVKPERKQLVSEFRAV